VFAFLRASLNAYILNELPMSGVAAHEKRSRCLHQFQEAEWKERNIREIPPEWMKKVDETLQTQNKTRTFYGNCDISKVTRLTNNN